MWTAFPPSDYYEDSVTIGVSPRRQSRVPFDFGDWFGQIDLTMRSSMRTLLIALGVVVVVILAAVLLLWVYDLTYVPGGWFSYSSLSASPRVVPPFSVVVLQLLNALFIGVVAVAVLVFAYYLFKVRTPHEGARQRAENKVRMSDPILRDDIVILARTNSQLLDDAIALWCAQIELGRDPDV